MRTYSKVILPVLLLHAAAVLVCADPMGTAFNYQGYLTFQGKAVTGPYDIQFKLFDAANNGTLKGTVTHMPAYVDKGLFTTNIDFTPFVFDGNAYWLEIGVRPNINNPPNYEWKPRLQIRPVPYALFASNAATANGVSANAVGGLALQNNSITEGKIASGQVVKSLNGLFDNVSLVAGANVTLTPNNNTLTIASSGGGSAGWSLTGNGGTTPGVNFLGTTDNQPLELHVNNRRSLRLEHAGFYNPITEQGSTAVNLIGGYAGNQVLNGAIGATIAGGGYVASGLLGGDYPNQVGAGFGSIGGGADNRVTGLYGTIGGGKQNRVTGPEATVPGGVGNEATGAGSFAAGRNAHANHNGSFVWGDGTGGAFSAGPNRFDVRATGGASFYTENNYLRVVGPYLQVSGAGGEEAYIGGDCCGGDVQVGSFNPSIANVALYNAGNNTWMNLLARDATVRTLTITGGADLAEPFQVSENEIPKGSVVIIDAENPGKLKLSSEPYDTRVAGIVSGAGGVQPGIQMSQKGSLEGTENVALSGRVYVLADAAHGAISPGDLLTTSATRGHAMKVSDHTRAQGATLGKAMSALREGKGLVLVLVTLQ